MSEKFRTVFVLGPPGCGKGTQCEKVAKNLGWLHLSAGDLLRAEQNRKGSQFGALIDDHIRQGTIVPVEITCKLIETAMRAAPPSTPGFLVDGFPRNHDNMEGWNKEMNDKANLLMVMFLDAPDEVCNSRIMGRGQGRADDNPESLKKRLVTYRNHTMPIVDHYDQLGLVRKIDASAQPDAVWEKVKSAFDALDKA